MSLHSHSYRAHFKSVYNLDLTQVPTRGELADHNEPCWHCSNLFVNRGGSVVRPPYIFYVVVIGGFERKLHRRCVKSLGFNIPRV